MNKSAILSLEFSGLFYIGPDTCSAKKFCIGLQIKRNNVRMVEINLCRVLQKIYR